MNSEDILCWDEPLLFKNVLDWELLKWKEEEWRHFFQKDDISPFRKGNFHCSKEPQWERFCTQEDMRMSDFLTIFFNQDQNENWYYFDYKHLAHWFKDNLDQFKISWKCVGFPDLKAEDSTLWIGTKGAHTPCHSDTYGCNFVAQLYGRKSWLMFSPSETDNLKPTRVPYEESSIYSDYNYFCTCHDFPKVKEGKIIHLDPGDVLYVPKKWWHFVQNETSAISVNTWIPLESDNKSRIEESLIKLFVSNLVKDLDANDSKKILNPNEEDITNFSLSQSIHELDYCIKKAAQGSKLEPIKNKDLEHCKVESSCGDLIQNKFKSLCLKESTKELAHTNTIGYKQIINSFCHPDVISLISSKISKS